MLFFVCRQSRLHKSSDDAAVVTGEYAAEGDGDGPSPGDDAAADNA